MVDMKALLHAERERRRASAAKGGGGGGQAKWGPGQADVHADGLPLDFAPRDPIDLSAHATGAPAISGLHFVADFITKEEERGLLHFIYSAPASRWISSAARRVQNWGGRPAEARLREPLPPFLGRLVDAVVDAGLFPPEERPNHVLINEYHGGAGLDPHWDGPLYSSRVALITLSGSALLEFWDAREAAGGGEGGGEAVFRTRGETSAAPPEGEGAGGTGDEVGEGEGEEGEEETPLYPVVGRRAPVAQVLMKPRSVLLAAGPAYERFLHGIAERPGPRPGDVVGPLCANAAEAGAREGQWVPRGARRLSIVFVFKRLPGEGRS